MTEEELGILYEKELSGTLSFEEATVKLRSLQKESFFQELCRLHCDRLVSILTENYIKYNFDLAKEPLSQCLLDSIEMLSRNKHFYWAFYYFLKKQYSKCKDEIGGIFEELKDIEEPISEGDILNIFVVPFKNAFDGFWRSVINGVKSIRTEESVLEFCEFVEKFFSSDDNNQLLEYLQGFIQKYPAFRSPVEWIAYIYYVMSMWNNAIAYFERVEEPYIFDDDERYFMLAWAYGKTKDYAKEEYYYRKCLDLNSQVRYLKNNLGYSLYRQKKYAEAKAIFEQCLQENIDLPYAANNYVRVLIAIGRNADAKKFIKDGKFRVSKSLKDRVAKLDNMNARIKKNLPVIADDDETIADQSFSDIGIKRQQFSNEKLLEDELTARIEAGMPVFDLELKVYKRHGEYGRQYIIPIGRLDLLCEDSKGNLYIIELKKDSGYGDAYKQLSDYLNWFENSEKFKGKQIFGIICLNNPTQELISKVHVDKRMKLYEYQITYSQR